MGIASHFSSLTFISRFIIHIVSSVEFSSSSSVTFRAPQSILLVAGFCHLALYGSVKNVWLPLNASAENILAVNADFIVYLLSDFFQRLLFDLYLKMF